MTAGLAWTDAGLAKKLTLILANTNFYRFIITQLRQIDYMYQFIESDIVITTTTLWLAEYPKF